MTRVVLLLSYGKDVLGLLGTILVTVPFFRERPLRRIIQIINDPTMRSKRLEKFDETASAVVRQRLLEPDTANFWLIFIGLVFLSISFALSIVATSFSPPT
jgi:hypothetical protein